MQAQGEHATALPEELMHLLEAPRVRSDVNPKNLLQIMNLSSVQVLLCVPARLFSTLALRQQVRAPVQADSDRKITSDEIRRLTEHSRRLQEQVNALQGANAQLCPSFNGANVASTHVSKYERNASGRSK